MTDSTSSPIPQWRLDAPSGLSLAEARRRATPAPADRASLAEEARPLQVPFGKMLRPEVVSRWRGVSVSFYTPQQIELTLRNALMGDLTSQWELFDLMEDTWPRLAKNLAEIKRAVTAMQWTVRPWAEDGEAPTPDAEERAALVSHAIWRMQPNPAEDERNFSGLLYDLMDAWGKGISVCELIWEPRETKRLGEIITLHGAQWVHPQHYAVGSDGSLGLRMDAVESMVHPGAKIDIEPFPPYKFVIGLAKARTVHFAAAAMLRPLAWWWAAANFGSDWLLNYAQLFGVPIRWANYAHGTPDAMITKIGTMLTNMGSAGWAAFPEGVSLELHEPRGTATNSPQDSILDRADTNCDLLLLGQTLTSDAADRGTQALGTVHERIRGDVLTAATEWVSQLLTDQLAPAIIELNYGDRDDLPEIIGEPVREEDKLKNAQRDQILLNAGVPMPAEWFYERHDIPLPGPDDQVIGARSQNRPQDAPEPPDPNQPPASAGNARCKALHLRCKGVPETASSAGMPDAVEAVAAAQSAALAAAFQGPLAPVREIILASRSPDEALEQMVRHFADWPAGRVAALTEEALQLCAVAGLAPESDPLTAGSPNQPRDDHGRWTRTAGVAARYKLDRAEFTGSGKTRRLKMADGSDAPEHIQKLRLPPAWSDIHVSRDPKADLQAVGMDAKGRVQRVYSRAAVSRNAEKKWRRNNEALAKENELRQQVQRDLNHRDPAVRENAAVMALIQHTGIRPGSTTNTRAEKQAYGATTLEGRHVVAGKDGSVRLKFTGKKGVALDLPVTDPAITKLLRTRAREAGPDGKLFQTNSRQLLDYTHSLDGGGFKVKDFRTLVGTRTAMEALGASPTRAGSMKAYKKRVSEIAKRVAKKLGNTPAIALQSYINPAVFDVIRPATS